MSATLLPTSRLYPPKRGRGVLPRPRLEVLAPQLLERTLTVLKAPPGFGKTTLAAAWVEALNSPALYCAWLTLDNGDDSPARVLYGITAALQHVLEQPLKAHALSQELPFVATEQLAIQLLNDIDVLPKPLLLVLDDCHILSEKTLDEALHLLLRHPPEHVHLLMISRTALPEKLLSYVQGEPVVELDGETLRFQLEETKALLNRAGIDIAASELAQLQEATAGWSTALRAYMLGASGSKETMINSSVPRSLNLLFEEVLEGLEPEFLEQLLPLSQLPQFNLSLLEHCFGAGATAFLEQLEQGQFFLSNQAQWYSFHPLFRSYLQQRYQQATELSQINAFRLNMAHWLYQQQQRIDAISLALAAADLPLAEQWISQCAMDLVEQGELYTLMQWEKQLREQMPVLPAMMRLALGWAAGLALQQDKGQQLLNSIKGEPNIDPWEYRALQAMLMAFDGRGIMAGRLAQECLPHFSNRPWIENVLINVQRYGYLHAADWQAFYNLPPLASQALSRSRYIFNRLYQYGIEAIAEIQQARLDTATQQLKLAITMLDENHANNTLLYALPRAFLAQIKLLKGQYEDAQIQLDASQIFTSMLGFPELIVAALGSQARLEIQQGKFQNARQTIERIEALGLTRLCPILLSFALKTRCELSIRENKIAEAKACSQLLQQLFQEQQQPPLPLQYARLTTGLNISIKNSEPLGILITEAQQLAQELDQFGKQLEHIELQLLLAKAQENNAQLEHWQQVAKVYGLDGVLDNLGINAPLAVAQNDVALLSLTVKERLILQEIARGQSNKVIAKTMGVAPETIKTHLKNIYVKLGVNNRTQAALMLNEMS